MILKCDCLQKLSFYVDIFCGIFRTWHDTFIIMDANKQTCMYIYIYILRASIFTHISCTYYTHFIFISYAYHSKNCQIFLRYWWHLGNNHATCWPFSTRNRQATINKWKNTNLTPTRAPQHMLTYVYLCPYLGFWPTNNAAITPEIVSRSQTHQHGSYSIIRVFLTFHAHSTAQERADLGVRF